MVIINHGYNDPHQSGPLSFILTIMIITLMTMMMMQVIVLTISSLVYFAEKDGIKKWTFLESFWSNMMVVVMNMMMKQEPKN